MLVAVDKKDEEYFLAWTPVEDLLSNGVGDLHWAHVNSLHTLNVPMFRFDTFEFLFATVVFVTTLLGLAWIARRSVKLSLVPLWRAFKACRLLL